jgi:adenine-specific DNA-methyltransferase
MNLRPRSDEQLARYKNPDNHPKGPWVPGDLTANVKGGRYVASLNYPIVNPNNGSEHWPSANGNWRFSAERVQELLNEDAIYFGQNGDGAPKLKRFLKDVKPGTTWTTLWDFVPLNAAGSQEMEDLFGNSTIFESPKPVDLLVTILEAASGADSLVLDFFAGSSSMAAAVMKSNARDGGKRRFIMVQLPESTHEDSVAAEAGYETIAELSRARVRLSGDLIREQGKSVDVGFRALRIESTNMADVLRTPDEVEQDRLSFEVDSIKEGRTGEDLLFEVLLNWGLELTMAISVEQIDGHEVFVVEEGVLVACFEDEVSLAVVRSIAESEPLRAVFRDAGFASDADRINAEQVFAEVSPGTDVKAV